MEIYDIQEGSCALKKIKVMLEYFYPWTNSAGIYLARENGWYREAGLDVEIMLYDPIHGDTLTYLSEDEVDFGVFPTNRLFVLREKHPDVIGIAAVNQRGMETIQTIKKTGIKRPADLSGKRIALNPTPRGLAMVKHLIRLDGGDPDSIIVHNSGAREYNAEIIANGTVDATFGSYWAWDILLDTTVPENKRIVWPVDEIGAVPYHSYLLGVNVSKLRDPELIVNFLAVTARGYSDAVQNPKSAVRIYEKVLPYFSTNLIERSLPLISPTWFYEGKWGVQRQDLMEQYAHWLYQNNILNNKESWKSAYTNEFLPKVYAQ